MITNQNPVKPWLAALALAALGAVTQAQAGTVTASTNAPVVDGNDIANYGGVTGDDKWWYGNRRGQTFMTGDGALRLKAFTYQLASGALPDKTYTIRVGKVSGTNFTLVHTETVSQNTAWQAGDFVTWTFATPVILDGSTTYGVDVDMDSSTLDWSVGGLPYLNTTGNEYPLGSGYGVEGHLGGGPVVADNVVTLSTADRIFHLDLEPPLDGGFNFVAGNPPDDEAAALIRPDLVGTFSQNLVVGTGNITLRNLTDATNIVISIGGPGVVITNNLLKISTSGRIFPGKSYAIQMDSGALLDQSSNPFAGITDDTTWNFDTGNDPLLVAVAALKGHINGSAPLDAAQIEAHKLTIDQNLNRFPESATTISNVCDLVRTYDTVLGPLWVSRTLPSRAYVVNDIHWTIYGVMQNILDTIYTSQTLALNENLLNSFKFNSSSNFPGACAPPAIPNQLHTAIISANYLNTRGPATQGDGPGTYARKPTGTYLAPGTIATITVPPALANAGYKIRVGAHSWDFSNRPNIPRLDRSTVVYNITATQTKVASPLGGGIYIEVPFLASNGIVNVDITGAVRSPYFSAKSFHTTTPAQWLIERTNAAPWADFQSDKFMMQVPRSWIYAMPDPSQLMTNCDLAMDAMNDLMGFPRVRGKETMYPQVDLQLRAAVYAPGYPSVNNSYSPTTDYGGYLDNYLIRGPQFAPDYYFHEQGHSYFFPKFGGESESAVNLHHVAVWNQKLGFSLDEAFRASRGYTTPYHTLDTAAIAWMCSFNFSPREQPMAQLEKQYQLKGHAKFVDIALLYGWEKLNDFWGSMVDDVENGDPIPANDDDKLLRLSKIVGKDIRPLFHFWGIYPQNPEALAAAIAAEGIPADTAIRDRLLHYATLVPTNNAAFRNFATNWWGRKPLISGYWEETDHAMQWDETPDADGGSANANIRPNGDIYVEASAIDITNRIQELVLLYFPGPVTPNPMRFAVLPSGVDPTTIGMAATNATAAIGPVEYYFENVTNGNFRTWGTSPLWNDTGLTTGEPYGYRVRARDASTNVTDWSAVAVAIPETDVKFPVPNPMKFAVVPRATNETTITMTAVNALDASGVEYYFENLTAPGHSSGWQDTPVYTDINLTPKTQYTYRVRARDKSPAQNTTTNSASFWATTDFTLPTPNPMTWATPPTALSGHWITMTAATASDTSGVEYYFENRTVLGHDSGWQNSPTYIDTGLDPNTEYTYLVRARDKSLNDNVTDDSAEASATTTSAVAALLTWDANNLVPAQTDGAGSWFGANLWWNGSANTNWISGADVAFGNGGTGGNVTLTNPVTVNTLTLDAYSGSYNLGSAGQTITISNGIVKTVTSGNLIFNSPVALAAPQTWANVSANAFTTANGANLVNNNGHQLTIVGTGNMTFGVINQTAVALQGSGALVKNGSGVLSLGGANTNFTGNVEINGGVLRIVNDTNALGNGNVVTLNGGVLEAYWGLTFNRTLGNAPGQVQLTGGASGFSQNGNGQTYSITLNGGTSLVQWGTTYFNPSALVLLAPTAQGTATVNFQNRLDLNGADRTVQTSLSTGSAGYGRITGVITNSTGTAGLIKTGNGELRLEAANTYNGGTTLQAGTLKLLNPTALGSTNGALTVNAGLLDINNQTVTIGNLTGTGGTIANNGNAARTLTIGAGNATGGIYQGVIADNTNSGTGTLALTKTGTGALTLTGANIYSGVTTVSTGKLFIHGDQTAAFGSVNVSSNATLGGTGTLGGDTTVEDTAGLEFDLSTPAVSHDILELAPGKTFSFLGASVLTITSSGGASPGTYTLLTAPGGISGVVPATVNLPAGWLANSPAIVGNDLVIQITSTGGPAAPSPALLTNSVTGSTLHLSWPAGQGWRLQEQTNALHVGLRTNWVYVTDSSVNSTNITVDKTKPTTFYRLVYP